MFIGGFHPKSPKMKSSRFWWNYKKKSLNPEISERFMIFLTFPHMVSSVSSQTLGSPTCHMGSASASRNKPDCLVHRGKLGTVGSNSQKYLGISDHQSLPFVFQSSSHWGWRLRLHWNNLGAKFGLCIEVCVPDTTTQWVHIVNHTVCICIYTVHDITWFSVFQVLVNLPQNQVVLESRIGRLSPPSEENMSQVRKHPQILGNIQRIYQKQRRFNLWMLSHACVSKRGVAFF